MPESRSESVLPNQRYEVVGTRPIRHDGVDKVTGQARYGADIRLPGMLYGKVLRSPHAHARILSIDTSRAEALPGVHAVVTAADLVQHAGRITDVTEGMMHNLRFMSNNILAADKVLYKGHAVVAVAATSVHVAEEALGLIAVAYEVLPAVLTAAEAMQPDAPLLHERLAAVTNVNIRPGGLLSSAIAIVNPNGTITLIEGSPDVGGSRTSAAQQCAEVLGLPVTDIHPAVGDTDAIGFTSVTGGSSVTFKTGWAVYQAAQDVKQAHVRTGRKTLGVSGREGGVRGGRAATPGGHDAPPHLQTTCGAPAGHWWSHYGTCRVSTLPGQGVLWAHISWTSR